MSDQPIARELAAPLTVSELSLVEFYGRLAPVGTFRREWLRAIRSEM